MHVGVIIVVIWALVLLYGIFTADMAVRDLNKKRASPSTMDDEAGLKSFSFTDKGFRFSVSRSETLALHINRYSKNDSPLVIITKAYIMVDTKTNMPFMVSICRVNHSSPSLCEPAHVSEYRPIWNKLDMIEQLSNLDRAHKIGELNLDDFVYQDSVIHDEDLMLASQGLKASDVT